MTNHVELEGRVSRPPERRELPSGDTIWVVRVVVPRDDAGVDWVDCSVWAPRLHRAVARWGEGDTVQVSGALRRRFYRTPAGPTSLVEVETTAGRIIRRATHA